MQVPKKSYPFCILCLLTSVLKHLITLFLKTRLLVSLTNPCLNSHVVRNILPKFDKIYNTWAPEFSSALNPRWRKVIENNVA